MINWKSNVFPGILGRTCDRPCEPACRRVRVEDEPVAICRLKRVAADYKDDIQRSFAEAGAEEERQAHRAASAAAPLRSPSRAISRRSATTCVVFDGDPKAGGMIRTQIPKFRLPDSVIDEETGYILDLGVDFRAGTRIDSMKALLAEGWDAIFVGSGAPRGRDLDIPGRKEAAKNIHIGIDWLSSVSFGHIDKIGRRVVVLGGGNTAMDCCRSARRLGGEEVQVVVRSGFEEMKASPWEKEDAMHEGIPIHNFLVPKEFTHEDGKLTGITFEKVKAEYDAKGRRKLVLPASRISTFPATTCWSRSARRTPSPGSSATSALNSTKMGHAEGRRRRTFASTHPKVFFGGDAAFGPKNIIWAVAHGHEAAVSIDKMLNGEDIADRPLPAVELMSQKMGIHEWSYDNEIALDQRYKVPHRDNVVALKDIKAEVELGFDLQLAVAEARPLPQLRRADGVFGAALHRMRRLRRHLPDGLHHLHAERRGEAELRTRLTAPAHNLTQDLYVQDGLKTGRVMVKDEDVCLHCGLCAERCPTGAWDMQKFLLEMTYAGTSCRPQRRSAA